jgi:hypothetical protein
MFSVTVLGLSEVEAQFARMPGRAAEAVRLSLMAAGVLVEGDAKRIVHSDSNPWTGSANPYYKTPTGKLQSSISTGSVEGSGINQQVRVGVLSRGGSFGRSVDSGRRTKSGHRIAAKSAVNKSDVQVYGPIEEGKHPFMQTAAEKNVGSIRAIFIERFQALVFGRAA